jgi:hypothetical protein
MRGRVAAEGENAAVRAGLGQTQTQQGGEGEELRERAVEPSRRGEWDGDGFTAAARCHWPRAHHESARSNFTASA